MSQLCACGNAVENDAAVCPRCMALQTLGLTSTATRTDVDSAWRMMAKVWHPDRFPGDEKLQRAAAEKLKAINAAHAALASGFATSRPRPAPPPSAPPEPQSGPAAMRAAHRPIRFHLPRWCVLGFTLTFLLASVGVLLKVTDAWLGSQSGIAPTYKVWRAQLVRTIEVNWNRTWGGMRSSMQPGTATSSPVAAPELSTEPEHSAPAHAAAVPRVRGVQPYVTVGLTPSEVEAVLGPPTSASTKMLVYGASALYLLDGKVAGWKIDPASPLRVKLWPSLPVDHRITSFTVGSSRDEVVALQGTPTALFADKFGYGGSEVYFENDRVTGWKNDTSSNPLRVTTR